VASEQTAHARHGAVCDRDPLAHDALARQVQEHLRLALRHDLNVAVRAASPHPTKV
jgi:hypothetical protein